jgi:hypothetical protein
MFSDEELPGMINGGSATHSYPNVKLIGTAGGAGTVKIEAVAAVHELSAIPEEKFAGVVYA